MHKARKHKNMSVHMIRTQGWIWHLHWELAVPFYVKIN